MAACPDGNTNDLATTTFSNSFQVNVQCLNGKNYIEWLQIIAWLTNSMELVIGKPFMFLPSTKEVWDAVKDTYSDIQNSSQIFGLKSRL